jgi:glyoxylase-like metal-dependent hydrolase (beta-lactamase superfamily II)
VAPLGGYSVALVAIDTQFPDTAKTFINGLNERGASSMDLLVNSHHHNNHTAGNGVFFHLPNTLLRMKTYPPINEIATKMLTRHQ